MNKCAFTLAEVLITIGIVGIVAALTIPPLVTKCQKYVLKQQFKKQYSVFNNALKTVDTNLDYIANCYYWSKRPSSTLPSDWLGQFSDCDLVGQELQKVLKVTQVCKGRAYEKGCIPKYKGNDTIYKENNPEVTDEEAFNLSSFNSRWRQVYILNYNMAWVLIDGTIIEFYDDNKYFPILFLDINGKKGPNKWGWDVFPFMIKGDGETSSTLKADNGYSVVDKGGVSTDTMIKNLFTNK